MRIGLYDVDSHNLPNLPLMKISAYHKAKGDTVEFADHFTHYDKVYVSKVFGDEYSFFDNQSFNADEVIFGGTGFAITVENGKEVYHKDRDKALPYEIEHIYPDYSLYPEFTKNTAYGFLTRGCCNNCDFCIVSKKEGFCSTKVADLSEWWRGQKNIKLLDANILACKDRLDLIQQLIDSNARVDFTQGLDARFITVDIAKKLNQVNCKMWHFAFDFMKNREQIVNGLKNFVDNVNFNQRNASVYILTNFDTTIDEDLQRIEIVESLGLQPDMRVYRKETAPQVIRDLQRWCNNRFIYRSCKFMDYVPRKDGKTIKQLYFDSK